VTAPAKPSDVVPRRSLRRFVVVGHDATTSPSFSLDDLAGATGRLDVLLRCVNAAFFLSHDLRRDVEVHLVLLGPPSPPKTVRLVGGELRYLNPDERSTAALVRKALATATSPLEARASPGIYGSVRPLAAVLDDLPGPVVRLQEGGPDIRRLAFPDDVAFVLSDHHDFTPEEEALLRARGASACGLGPRSLHADHCIVLVHNELDRRESREG
jgi:tRNA (pseudouridine54-N1)-methyltransferase